MNRRPVVCLAVLLVLFARVLARGAIEDGAWWRRGLMIFFRTEVTVDDASNHLRAATPGKGIRLAPFQRLDPRPGKDSPAQPTAKPV